MYSRTLVGHLWVDAGVVPASSRCQLRVADGVLEDVLTDLD